MTLVVDLVDKISKPPPPSLPRIDHIAIAVDHSLKELQQLCRQHGLPCSGRKEQLAWRLAQARLDPTPPPLANAASK